jgi:hypothetical protein
MSSAIGAALLGVLHRYSRFCLPSRLLDALLLGTRISPIAVVAGY